MAPHPPTRIAHFPCRRRQRRLLFHHQRLQGAAVRCRPGGAAAAATCWSCAARRPGGADLPLQACHRVGVFAGLACRVGFRCIQRLLCKQPACACMLSTVAAPSHCLLLPYSATQHAPPPLPPSQDLRQQDQHRPRDGERAGASWLGSGLHARRRLVHAPLGLHDLIRRELKAPHPVHTCLSGFPPTHRRW